MSIYNRSKQNNKRNIDQNKYSDNQHVKRLAIGKAISSSSKVEDNKGFNVFKCGMNMLDMFKVQQSISRDMQKKVCMEVANELKPPYNVSKYALSNGIMPQAELEK